jgi:hypothetical protein
MTARPCRLALAAAALATGLLGVAPSPASAKGTPSTVTVTCAAGVSVATVTVQLVDAVATNKPASPTITLACGPGSFSKKTTDTATLKATTSPAAAFAWSAFVTSTATFGCGGQASRGTTVTCTYNGAPGVTITAT